MWRIYSPDKSGVKVKTTIGKLIDSLDSAREIKSFIGKVSYLPDADLRDNLQSKSWLEEDIVNTTTQATSLLFQEIRVRARG
jgi:hypothetical protein